MSSSTTHQKKSTSNGPPVDIEVSAFARELTKKIRNKQKKLENIVALEQKVLNKEIKANEEQCHKIASKVAIEAEIAEVKVYLDLYTTSQAESTAAENKMKKQHAKELNNSKKSTVTTMANMITMHTMIECG